MFKKFGEKAVSRRSVLTGAGTAMAAAAVAPTLAPQQAKAATKFETAMAEAAGGKTPTEGRITLNTPEIAENGNTVPIGFTVESPMTPEDYVQKVTILADGNPSPDVASFQFSHTCGKAEAGVRMRMAKTQNIVAVAQMSNGEVFTASAPVKVTIGGCGG